MTRMTIRIVARSLAGMLAMACGQEVAPTPGGFGEGSGSGGDGSDPQTSGESGAAPADDTGEDDGDTGGDSDGREDESDDDGGPAPIPDAGGFERCEAPSDHVVCDGDSDDVLHALGLDCPGDATDSTPVTASTKSAKPVSLRVVRQYGLGLDDDTGDPVWGPREGDKFVLLSTGRLELPDADGIVAVPRAYLSCDEDDLVCGFENLNPDYQQLPPPIEPAMGSNGGAGGTPFADCDGFGDCSDTLAEQWALGQELAHDLAWFQIELTAPPGTHGFELDLAFFSAEFPEFVDSEFNDMFIAWVDTPSYSGNISFIDGQPLTVTAVSEVMYDSGLWGDAPAMEGTGFDGMMPAEWCLPENPHPGEWVDTCPAGGGTGWFTASGPADPGETLRLTFALFDMGDDYYDTVIALDHFRWSCVGCTAEGESCGVEPAG